MEVSDLAPNIKDVLAILVLNCIKIITIGSPPIPHLQFKHRTDLHKDNIEITWIELVLLNTRPLLIGSVYRHPKSHVTYYDTLSDHLQQVCNEEKETFCLGDINSDILINGYHKKKITELCDGNLLTLLVK